MKIDKLTILWTSGDPETAANMILLYALTSNQRKRWKECNLIIWGPANKLLCEDPEVEQLVEKIIEAGVKVYSCDKNAEYYGVSDRLKDMGVEVKLVGDQLTEYLQDDSYRVITL